MQADWPTSTSRRPLPVGGGATHGAPAPGGVIWRSESCPGSTSWTAAGGSHSGWSENPYCWLSSATRRQIRSLEARSIIVGSIVHYSGPSLGQVVRGTRLAGSPQAWSPRGTLRPWHRSDPLHQGHPTGAYLDRGHCPRPVSDSRSPEVRGGLPNASRTPGGCQEDSATADGAGWSSP